MRNLIRLLIDGIIMIVLLFCLNMAMAAFSPSYGQTGNIYRCGEMTTKGTPCKMRVKQMGSKCHHHAENGTANATVGKNSGSAVIHTCGATTAKGTPCKRRVKIQGAKCYSHE